MRQKLLKILKRLLTAAALLLLIGIVAIVVLPPADGYPARLEAGAALATLAPLKADVDAAIAAGKKGNQVFAPPDRQPNALGILGGSFDDHGVGAVTFSFTSSSVKTEVAPRNRTVR